MVQLGMAKTFNAQVLSLILKFKANKKIKALKNSESLQDKTKRSLFFTHKTKFNLHVWPEQLKRVTALSVLLYS